MRNNTSAGKDIEQEFVESLKSPLSNTNKWKWIRYVPQALLGGVSLVGGYLGLAATGLGVCAATFDAFCAADIIDRKSPTTFLETIKKSVDDNAQNNEKSNVTFIPCDDSFMIDNEAEEKYNSRNQLQQLSIITEAMQNAKDEDERYSLYTKGIRLVERKLYSTSVVKYLLLNHLLGTYCPSHYKEAIIKLDEFLYILPLGEPIENQDITAKYYFQTVINVFLSKEVIWDKTINLKCIDIIGDDLQIKSKTERIDGLYKRFLKKMADSH